MMTKLATGHLYGLAKINIPGSETKAPYSTMECHGASNTIYLSMLSAAEAFFGNFYKVTDLLDHSVVLYRGALAALRDDLTLNYNDAVYHTSYMRMWTSLLLCLYEWIFSTDSTSWLNHSQGLSTMVRAFIFKARPWGVRVMDLCDCRCSWLAPRHSGPVTRMLYFRPVCP